MLGREFLAGSMFVGFGSGALWFARHLPIGTAMRMGPGYIPHALAYLLLVLGFVIAAIALIYPGERCERPKWKPLGSVTIAIVCFALLFEVAGMFPALVALVLIASWGGGEFNALEVTASIAVLTVLCVVVFKLGLGMNVSIVAGIG
ncbi:tripartite tricarboxylate transporter TctB family protein [Bradyrhizobium liaoningense]|uniref:tripartite tricarboxylate transporter TctB family protein n=1 Tax=Bradyrhizobium liaoningense TaxID=43992 RepID=UPI001BADFE31|nr:tripartite tricarboxylate transporter TctB family protein [Bradyrhizobium liaoningense]MBR0843253.1 tripartite tricarboxylate transporter TctB family protein [Bradyrhizobium liaoningense]